MKLIYCKQCGDLFSLSENKKSCKCLSSEGIYVDEIRAVYSGSNAVPIGISNSSFVDAILNQPDGGLGTNFLAFVVAVNTETFKKVEKITTK